MPYVDRPNQPALFYELDDYTDPWKKAPVILLQHGFARNSRFWQSWVPYLSRFYRVVRPDLRGLGKSSAEFDFDKGINLENYLKDIEAVIDHVGEETVHYCGESLGGILGMAFAAEFPTRVRTLSLVAAPLYISEQTNKNAMFGYSSRVEAFKKMGSRGWAEASNAGRRFPPDGDQGMMNWTVEQMGQADVNLLIAGQNFVLDFSAEPYLHRIKAPVLGVYPHHGPIAGNEQLELMREKIPDVRIVHVDLQYHMVQMLKPATCANAVLHFAAQFDGIACHE